MPKIQEVKPATVDASLPIKRELPPKCVVTHQPDGAMQVAFLIESQTAQRLMRKAGGMGIERYLWENILQRAVTDHVY